MKNIMAVALTASLALTSCKQTPATDAPTEAATPATHENMAKIGWLIGEWENRSDEGDLVENWNKVNDSLYMGKSYFIVKGDTVFAERVALLEIYGRMSYNVVVEGQNDGGAVAFEKTSLNNERVIFENPKHDYPSKIIYKKVGADSLVAEISGTKDGKHASEIFKMKRKG